MNATSKFENYTTSDAVMNGDIANAIAWKKRYFLSHYPELLPKKKSADILELGCGYGVYVRAMRDMGYRNCVGIDVSEEQVRTAETELGLTGLVRQADAFQWLDQRRGFYDCILALDVLEHLSTEQMLTLGRSIRCALKPGGRLIVQVPNGMAPMNPIRYGDLTHERAFTVQSINQFFKYAGLLPEQCRPVFPHAHSVLSVVQRAIWRSMISPMIKLFVFLLYGRVIGDIYTMNLIGVGGRSPDDGDAPFVAG